MRHIHFVLWIVLFFILLDFFASLHPALSGIGAGGTSRVIWLCRISLLLLYAGMGLLLLRLYLRFGRTGYLDQDSVRWLRSLAWMALGAAVLSSVQDAAQVLRNVEPLAVTGWQRTAVLVRAFAAHLLVRTPVQMLSALFLWLFADFVKRAASVKRENESFI